MKRKYAPGDEIVVVDVVGAVDFENGDVGVLVALDELWENIRGPNEAPLWEVRMKSGASMGHKRFLEENEFELAEIVHSPLWKALYHDR